MLDFPTAPFINGHYSGSHGFPIMKVQGEYPKIENGRRKMLIIDQLMEFNKMTMKQICR